jgi:endonuclease/exonuclease/phosphatase family metal-dependent hydrolase
VPQLLQIEHREIIIGGDLNCVHDPADTSAISILAGPSPRRYMGFILPIRGSKIRPDQPIPINTDASRIDRIYVSRNIASRITGIDFLPATFTDHNAVVVRLALDEMGAMRRPPRLKLDPTTLRDDELLNELRQQWSRWQTHT